MVMGQATYALESRGAWVAARRGALLATLDVRVVQVPLVGHGGLRL